ncbi:porin [Burkholderia multivorans]|nr:porin [Burkholderia multivorans]
MEMLKRAMMGVAMAAATSSGWAQSSVTMYGQIDVFAGMQKQIGGKTAWVQSSGGMSTSYFGMRGAEDLGGGMKAIFALEAFFQPQNGQIGRFPNDVFFSRNAYVGVETPYGTFKAGRQSANLFISTIVFNPFADSFMFSPAILQTYLGRGGQGVIGDTGWNNAIQYCSPRIAGLIGNAMYAFGNSPGAAGQRKWSAQFMYFHGPFSATGVYQYANYSFAAGDIGSALAGVSGLRSQNASELAASYDFRIAKLYAQYIRTANTTSTGNYTVNMGQAGFSIPVDVGFILGSFAYSKSNGPADGVARRTWAIGYDYPLSKRTDIYAAFLSDHLSGQSTGNTVGVGIRTKF